MRGQVLRMTTSSAMATAAALAWRGRGTLHGLAGGTTAAAVAATATAACAAGLARLRVAGLAALRLLAGLLRLARALEGVVLRAGLRGLLAMRRLARLRRRRAARLVVLVCLLATCCVLRSALP